MFNASEQLASSTKYSNHFLKDLWNMFVFFISVLNDNFSTPLKGNSTNLTY